MMRAAAGAPSVVEKKKQSTKLDQSWNVVVFDDPVNLMEYVARVFQSVFSCGRDRAEKLMLTVHSAGKAVVWTGGRERAELYVQQLHQHQLHASLEKPE